MAIYHLRTEVVNNTGLRIDFHVDDNGICPLRGLPPGESRSVSLSLIRKRCRERGSADWPIRVLINNRFCGISLHPRHHILKMTRIRFRYKWRPDGSSVPIVEGVVENAFDRFFPCCIKRDKRIYVQIAEADFTWRRNSEVGDVPEKSRQGMPISGSWRKRFILASSTINGRIGRLRSIGNGRIRTPDPPSVIINSPIFTLCVLFPLVFAFVVGVHLFLF